MIHLQENMLKSVFYAALFISTAVLSQASVKFFEFTSPASKEAWEFGTVQTIRWQIKGEAVNPPKVTLFYKYDISDSALNQFKTLAKDLDNIGSYAWNISTDLRFEGKYLLRICYDPECSGARTTSYPEAGFSQSFQLYRDRKNFTIYDDIDLKDGASGYHISFVNIFAVIVAAAFFSR